MKTNLSSAIASIGTVRSELRAALAEADPIEAIILFQLIEASAHLECKIKVLESAKEALLSMKTEAGQ